MADVKNGIERTVARMPGVRAGVRAELDKRAARVAAVVAMHRHTGALAAGTVVEARHIDSLVVMSDPLVRAINYGHIARDGSFVQGIHAIEAGL